MGAIGLPSTKVASFTFTFINEEYINLAECNKFSVSLFNGISTFMGYLMTKPSL